MNLELLDEFSKWLHDNGWCKNYNHALWYHYSKMKEHYKLSDVYQLFLTSKKTNK